MPSITTVASTPLQSDSMSHSWMRRIASHEVALRRIAILAALYLLPAMWILQPVISDPDIWWHLQAGKWMVEHGTLPDTDPFSAYGEGKPWVAYSWLFEIGMYGLVQLFGEQGILLYTLSGVWLSMIIVHRIIGSRCDDFMLATGLMTVSVVTLSKMFTPRPWLLTIVFFALTLEAVLRLRDGKALRWYWLLPVIYVIWANVHIQFIYGLGLLGLACAVPLVDRFIQSFSGLPPVMTWGSEPWKRLLGLTVLCCLATLATPYHARLYAVVLELAAQTGMWDYTQEMQAPAFRIAGDWTMLGMFACALIWLGMQRVWSSFDVLLMTVAAFSAFRGQRDVWFLVLASLSVLIQRRGCPSGGDRAIVPRGGALPLAFIVVAGVVAILGYRGISEVKIHENTAKVYPVKALDFVEAQGLGGPIYNHFNWGGYLIWRLPHLKVSMDGRANVHGDARIKQSIKTWSGESHWNEDLELDGARVVIAQKDMALSSLLCLDPRFQLTYQDETAVVFVSVRDGKE